jgi:UDP-N-acetylglucosamine 4,6-dehydratase
MAPDLPHEIVGIRPGEKIHETLISGDEARSTLELSDRYLIEPPMTFWRDRNPEKIVGKSVSRDFRYVSSEPQYQMPPETIGTLVTSEWAIAA